MDDLRDLYRQLILDHNQSPHNSGVLEGANRSAQGYNPLCGDHLHVHLHLENERIEDISFEGSGCAISKASASLMTVALKGKGVDEAQALFEQFRDMVMADVAEPVDEEKLGKMAIFSGVREFPMRVKCATLAWHTMKAALENEDASISTE